MKQWLTALMLLGAHLCVAQESDELDPVTITASLHPKQISATGRNLVVVKGERFTGLAVHSIDDLLRVLPGVEVQMRGPMGSQSDIVLRGGTFQQVLILLDGMRLNDPNTGHFNSYIPITPSEIDRVEILKGASSAIYGSDAVGGVIQIISKTFAVKEPERKLNASAQVGIGEYDLRHVNAGIYYQRKNTAISAGWLNNHTDGQPQRGTRGFVQANTFSAALHHQAGSAWTIDARVAYDDRNFAAQNFYTSFASDTASETVSTWWSQASVSYKGMVNHRLVLDVSYKQVKDEYFFTPRSVPNESTSEMTQMYLRDEWKAGEHTNISSGVQWVNKGIRSNDRGHHSLNQVGAYVLMNQQVTSAFSLNPALRLEWNKLSGYELVPQLSAAYRLKHILFRAMAGKTIRDADFTERFNNYNKALVTSGRVGNPNLEAERSFSYELGADVFVSKVLKLSATAFQRRHRKLIDYIITPYDQMPRQVNLSPGAVYALASNVSEVNTRGFEFDFNYNQHFGEHGGRLTAGAGLLWLNSESNDSVPSFYISSHAKWLLNFFAEYRIKGLSVSFSGIQKVRAAQKADPIQARLTSSYVNLNGKIAYLFAHETVGVFLQVNNLLDTHYSDLLGAVMPGRWLSAGLSLSLKK